MSSASRSSSLASSSCSSSPPPPTQISAKSKRKGKQKEKDAAHGGKNEGVDLNWAYAPPPGAELIVDEDADAGEFNWESVKNDDEVEMWLIRVPDGIKPKYFQNLQVDVPSSTTESARIGTLKRKHASFDIWSVADDNKVPIGGEEIKSISCLLPQKNKNGKLYPAPKPFARHLVVTAQDIVPTPPADVSKRTHKNPPRFSYPKEVLKHRFMPYGSMTTKDEATPMEVDSEPQTQTQTQLTPSSQSKRPQPSKPESEIEGENEVETKKPKGKKRKEGPADAAEMPAKKTRKSKIT